jgi:hypothetical protein
MKCSDLFENIRKHWPDEIDLNDNVLEQLNPIYWSLESKIDHDNKPWLDISAWAFHQAIYIFSKQEMKQGLNKLIVSQMPMRLFNEQMIFNLSEDCWEKERQLYEEA